MATGPQSPLSPRASSPVDMHHFPTHKPYTQCSLPAAIHFPVTPELYAKSIQGDRGGETSTVHDLKRFAPNDEKLAEQLDLVKQYSDDIQI